MSSGQGGAKALVLCFIYSALSMEKGEGGRYCNHDKTRETRGSFRKINEPS
jgi:hypothetical protein